MREKRMRFYLLAVVLLAGTVGSYRLWADDDLETFMVDVACDTRTYRQNSADPSGIVPPVQILP